MKYSWTILATVTVVVLVSLPISAARSQATMLPQAGQQSPASERALAQRVLIEINTALQCSTGLIAAQDELTKLKKENAELRAAATPK